MPHSLKSKIKSLCYKGELSEKERDRLIRALEQEPSEDCISREALRQKLQENQDFFINAFGGFKNMNYIDKARVDEIDNCIAMVVNAPSVTPQQLCEEDNPNCTECRYYDKEKHHCPRFCRVIENTVAEITSEQTGWIPVSERLPKKYETVLLTSIWHEVEKAMYIGDGLFDIIINNLQKKEVIAWMPLPQPYVESEDEE